MTDLNKERSEFESQHSDKVFKIVKFDEVKKAYCLHDHLPLTEINLLALAEINYGWDLWQKAKAQAVPVWISTDFMKPGDHDYVDILINGERRIVDAVYLDGKFFIFPPFSKEQWTEVNNKVTHWMPRVDVASESGADG